MRKILLASAIMLLATPAYAVHWNVDPVTSKLTFKGSQSDEDFEGSFSKFRSTINFDEAKPEEGSIHIAVTMDSLQVDGKDRMDSLPTSDWFDIKQFPFAEFVATSITKTGEHQYAAKGKLTIRGVAKEVTLPFTMKTVGKSTVAKGEVTINRQDFGVGQGKWKTEEWVKNAVKIAYEIHATSN